MMTASPFVRLTCRTWCTLAATAMFVALIGLLLTARLQTDMYAAVALNDSLGFYGRLMAVLTGMILLALAHEEPQDDRAGEFFGALLMITTGAMLVTTANELVFLFVGLELVSMPTYLLLYLSRRTTTTQEAATKYFYLSIFSSGLLLFGLAYLYGVAGVSNLKALAVLSSLPGIPHPQLGLIAVVFILAGLSFRVAAVPFHFYAPDVYEGSPTVIAALLSWVPKAVGFVAMVRALTAVISVDGPDDPLVRKAITISWVIAAATMTLGNTVALLQNNLKRLLAYSSIAHAGYLMIGVTAAFANEPRSGTLYYGCESIFFYLVAYALMTLGAFGVIIALRIGGRPVETDRRARGAGIDAALARPGAGDLPLEPERDSSSGGLLGQAANLCRGAGGELGREPRPIRSADGHRRLERGRGSVLLPADRGPDVLPSGQANGRSARRLAGGPGRRRMLVAFASSRSLPRTHRQGLARSGPCRRGSSSSLAGGAPHGGRGRSASVANGTDGRARN